MNELWLSPQQGWTHQQQAGWITRVTPRPWSTTSALQRRWCLLVWPLIGPRATGLTRHHLRVILIFLIFPEELEEGAGGAAEVEEAEMTHLSYISKGNGYLGYLTVSPPSSLYYFSSRLHLLDADRRTASKTAEIISPLFDSCCSMTHLAQTFPAFTDLNESAAEEALEQEEINGDQMTHNPPAISRGELETLGVSITTDKYKHPPRA